MNETTKAFAMKESAFFLPKSKWWIDVFICSIHVRSQLFFFFYVWVFYLHIYLYTSCMTSVCRVRRRHGIP